MGVFMGGLKAVIMGVSSGGFTGSTSLPQKSITVIKA